MSSNGKLSTLIPANRPFEFEGLDMRPSFRASENGHVYSVNIMVTEEVWNSLKTIPRHHIIGGVLFWTTGDDPPPQIVEEKPAKADKPKGEWGLFWQDMFRRGFYNSPELCEVLQVNSLTADSARQLLHDAFETTSLSLVSPSTFEDWCATHELHSLFTMSRSATAAVGAS